MAIPVRQSTAFECSIGPILDADGVAVTGGVVGDFKIKKTTGNFAALNGSATLTHVSAGIYDLVLTASDLDTVGLATIAIDDGVNACEQVRLQVMEEAIYDALYAASANAFSGAAGSTLARADTVAISGSSTAADNAEIVFATDFATNYNTTNDGWVVKLGDYAHGGSSASFVFGAGAAISNNDGHALQLVSSGDNGSGLSIVGHGTGAAISLASDTGPAIESLAGIEVASLTLSGGVAIGGALSVSGAFTATHASNDVRGIKLHASGVDGLTLPANLITEASIANDAITASKVAADVHQETIELAFTYDATATYAGADAGSLVKQIADNAGGSSLTAADIADAVWDEDATGHQTQGTFGQAIGDPVADSDTIWGLVNTNLNATVSSRSSHSAADVWSVGTRRLTDATNITSTGGTITVTSGGVTLANGVTHGGTTAVFRMERIIVTAASGTDRTAVTITGDGTGAGFAVSGGTDGTGMTVTGGINAGYGLQVISFAQEPVVINDWTGAGTGCIRLISNSGQGIIDGKISGIVGTTTTFDALQTAQNTAHGAGSWATATSVTVSDKTGFKLASDGLDSISTTAPSGVASNFREMVVQTWRRLFKKITRSSTQIKTYADNGTTVLTTQNYTSSGSDEDVGAAS